MAIMTSIGTRMRNAIRRPSTAASPLYVGAGALRCALCHHVYVDTGFRSNRSPVLTVDEFVRMANRHSEQCEGW